MILPGCFSAQIISLAPHSRKSGPFIEYSLKVYYNSTIQDIKTLLEFEKSCDNRKLRQMVAVFNFRMGD